MTKKCPRNGQILLFANFKLLKNGQNLNFLKKKIAKKARNSAKRRNMAKKLTFFEKNKNLEFWQNFDSKLKKWPKIAQNGEKMP